LWQPSSNQLFPNTNPLGGHSGVGYGWKTLANAPNATLASYPNGINCATVPTTGLCEVVYTLSGCTVNPGGADFHMSWPTTQNSTNYPVLYTSGPNNFTFARTNPPAWTCPLMSSAWATPLVGYSGSGNAPMYWLAKWYDNTLNNHMNFQTTATIWGMEPSGKFVIISEDMNSPSINGAAALPGGNTGLGTSGDTPCSPTCQPFQAMFAYWLGLNSSAVVPDVGVQPSHLMSVIQ
jgi:hypothetical protein